MYFYYIFTSTFNHQWEKELEKKDHLYITVKMQKKTNKNQ